MENNNSVFFISDLTDEIYTNDFCTSLYIFSGSCKISVASEEVTLKKNSYSIININNPYQIIKKTRDFKYIAWGCTYDFYNNFSNKFPNEKNIAAMANAIQFKKWNCGFIRIKDVETQALFNSLLQLRLHDDKLVPIVLDLKVMEIILYCFMNYEDLLNLPHVNVDVVNYIKNNLEDASLKGYAKSMFMSESAVANKLKQEHDQTFSVMKHNYQMSSASHLLSSTDKNIDDIIQSVGFKNKTYFYKLFKAKYNCSPKEYRKNFKT